MGGIDDPPEVHAVAVRETGPVAAVLAVENGWYVGEELVMVERIWMRAFRAAENDRAVDLELYFTPVKSISLQGAEGKSYGGLTVRFAPGTREETLITVPSGPTTDDLPDTPLAWADFTSRFGTDGTSQWRGDLRARRDIPTIRRPG